MNFSQTYFKKDLDQITSEDLVDFFKSPKKESQYLEFKSAREKNLDRVYTNTLKPGICSFLNSEGGILIYGAPSEDKRNPDHPFHQEVMPYPKGFLGDFDSIIRKISDGITPMPIGIRLKEVDFPNGSVAIFEIQESISKPHQTENIYQIRIEGQKKPAPHYLIEAMMKQVTFPDIRAYVKTIEHNYLDLEDDILCIKLKLFFLNFSEFQNEKNIRYRLIIDGPMDFEINRSNKKTDYKKFEILPFGEPISTNIDIFGRFGMLKDEQAVYLNIVFHGETSPSKITVYQFKIKPSNLSLRGFLVDGKAILEIDNLLLSEHEKIFGMSRKESLKETLGLDI
jgi:hypothetical protein